MAKIVNLDGRLNKSIANVATGFILQVLTILLSFVVRIVFVHSIGYSYLGISSLFANILTVLSVADLGFGTSISISLYAALRNKNEKQIAGILTFYKKVYLIIGTIIFVLGCIICPFVKYLVHTTSPIPFLELYFFIYLVNLVSTYFISYRHAIIKADQKNGVLNIINSAVLLFKSIAELLVLVIFPLFFDPFVAYITYLGVMVFSTYTAEIVSATFAKKLYPYAFKKESLPKEEKVEISKNVRSLLLYKICNAINKSVDSILISILVSTAILGKYSNYSLIIGTLMGFGCIVSRNAIASLGNFVLTESKEKQTKLFFLINFVHIIIAAFFVVNYVGILEPFFRTFFGLDSTLSILTLAFTAIHLGFDVNYQVNELFRESTKTFRKIPYIAAINLGLNIVLSIVLGIFFGLEGIIGGTLIAYFLTSFWFETFALFKFHLKTSSKRVWLQLLFSVFSIAVFSILTYFITSKIIIGEDFAQLVFSVIVSLIMSALCIASLSWFKEFKIVFNVGKKYVIKIYKLVVKFLSNLNLQLVSIILGTISVVVFITIRDVGGVEISKYVFVGVILVFALLLRKEFFLSYVLFLIPFHSGLPTGFIIPLICILFFLKFIEVFRNWRRLINYLLIPVFIGVYELIISSIYQQRASLTFVASLVSVLIMFAFIIYDKENTSLTPLKFFLFGAVSFGLILFVSWIKLSLATIATIHNEDMPLFKFLMKQRFGDVDKYLIWCKTWYNVDYSLPSMHLTDNPNYVGFIMLSAIMTSTFLLIKKEKIYMKITYSLGIIICLVLGIFTGSKSFFICLAGFFVFLLPMLYADNILRLFPVVVILGLLIIGGTLASVFVPYIRNMIINRMNDDSGRITLIIDYFSYVFKHPLVAIFGVGTTRIHEMSGLSAPPHNSIVQIVGGYGLFGFGVILTGLGFTVVKGRPRLHPFANSKLSIFIPLFVFLVFSMTSQIFAPVNTLIYSLPIIYLFIVECNSVKDRIPLRIKASKFARNKYTRR